MPERTIIGPQPGPQEQFLASPADIAIGGGAAGGGKTFALLLEALRHSAVPGFAAVIFRRKYTEISAPGGLRDASTALYSMYPGASYRDSPRGEWSFPSGAKVQFGHLEHEKNRGDWMGSEIALIGFDELITFTESQFWFLLSRNRSTCGVRPYVRATTNPEADSWVAKLIEWWIDEDTGYPIPERAGVLRWFVRLDNDLIWADSPEELGEHVGPSGEPIRPKSLTFIPAKLQDNKALMAINPDYEATLMALSTVERERFLMGNWKIRPAAGLYFQRGWVDTVEAAPAGLMSVRGWDLAATPESQGNDPDWTCGTLMGMAPNGHIYVMDHIWDRLSPGGVERLLVNTAQHDGGGVAISIPQDPGQAGKAQKSSLAKLLGGYDVRSRPVTGDKVTRFSPFSAQCEAGNVSVVRGAWNERWFRELENFPPEKDVGHDDDADSTSEAYGYLMRQKDIGGIALTVPELVAYS